MLSLRRRALIGGGLTAMIAVALGTLLLANYFDRLVLNRFDRAISERHTQLSLALLNSNGEPELLENSVLDLGYRTPFSGRYWQVLAPSGQIFASASLLDELLTMPRQNTADLFIGSLRGPEQELLRHASQWVTLEDGSRWRVMVAESQEELQREREQMLKSLLLGFAFVGVLGLAGAFLQTAAITAPITKLRRDVLNRWEAEEELQPEAYPEEVAPLVGEINELLDRNREIVGRARRQAADLAHALKTPSAIMRNELSSIAGETDVSTSLEALDRLDAQLGRSLARMRAANSGASTRSRTSLENSIERFERLFTSLAERDGKRLVTKYESGLTVSMDQQDIEEVVGNMLDNALKWCRSEIRLTAWRTSRGVAVAIEDDGPGIPEASQRDALKSGGRLDSSKPGTGLGLAIAVDLLQAYGATLELQTSEALGGLRVEIHIPLRISSGATCTVRIPSPCGTSRLRASSSNITARSGAKPSSAKTRSKAACSGFGRQPACSTP